MMNDITQELKAYEDKASPLADSSADFSQALETLQELATKFLDDLPEAPAHYPLPSGPISPQSLQQETFARQGQGLAPALQQVFARLQTSGIETAGSRYLGYIPGGGLPAAALGDFVAALTNRYAGLHLACPEAVAMENEVLSWMLDTFAFTGDAWGTLTSGGSLANLIGILAARETRPRCEWDRSPLYMTDQTHSALKRAIKIAGLDPSLVRIVPSDEHWRMDCAALARILADDCAQGLAPWIVVANLGSTNTGSVDPMPALTTLKEQYKFWLHADGAYGGFFMLTDLGRERLGDLTAIDSLVLDPHKGLFMPYGLGAVLVRSGKLLGQAFAEEAACLADLQCDAVRSPADYSPELTRHFRGARLYLSLLAYGSDAFAAALAEKLHLAHYAYQALQAMPGIVCACPPDLSVLAFRLDGPEQRTRQLFEHILQQRRVFLSSTRLNGRFYIRIAILSFRTHLPDVEECLQAIRSTLSALGTTS